MVDVMCGVEIAIKVTWYTCGESPFIPCPPITKIPPVGRVMEQVSMSGSGKVALHPLPSVTFV